MQTFFLLLFYVGYNPVSEIEFNFFCSTGGPIYSICAFLGLTTWYTYVAN